ncbi:MAG: hypothetical protein R3B13_08855 [Polyangiaceae bacterium]
MSRRPKRARTVAREADRARAKLAAQGVALARLELGGDPSRPSVVESPAQVEPAALSRRCPRCGGEFSLQSHDATTWQGSRLRVARVLCRACGKPWDIYFQLRSELAS